MTLVPRRASPLALSLSLTAVQCLCALLSARPDFNFRSNIVAAIVARLRDGGAEQPAPAGGIKGRRQRRRLAEEGAAAVATATAGIRRRAAGALEEVFAADRRGEATFELVSGSLSPSATAKHVTPP